MYFVPFFGSFFAQFLSYFLAHDGFKNSATANQNFVEICLRNTQKIETAKQHVV